MTKATAAVLVGISFIFFAPALGVLLGAFAGWVVGLFFTETIIGFLTRVGFDTAGYAMWQVGAALGFIGSFFKSSSVSSK